MIPLLLAVISLICLYQAWAIGANDVANSMGVAVGSKSLSLAQAILLAAIFEFAGCILAGADVTSTVSKGIVDPARFASCPERFVVGMTCALLACALWIHLATWLGLPVSSTYSIVGAVAGFGVVAWGWSAVHWKVMLGIIAAWFLSPVAGLALGYIIFRLLIRTVLGRGDPLAALVRACPAIVFLGVGLTVLGAIYNGLGSLSARVPWLASAPGACVTAALLALAAAAAARPIISRYVRRAP
ncbi:MAG TPA: inorganic phosphate transporter, partial [Candidatus Brocadiia bacterium]|nr:inorganic phosphate transporter [Candidatus Brocadiia bacterium]